MYCASDHELEFPTVAEFETALDWLYSREEELYSLSEIANAWLYPTTLPELLYVVVVVVDWRVGSLSYDENVMDVVVPLFWLVDVLVTVVLVDKEVILRSTVYSAPSTFVPVRTSEMFGVLATEGQGQAPQFRLGIGRPGQRG